MYIYLIPKINFFCVSPMPIYVIAQFKEDVIKCQKVEKPMGNTSIKRTIRDALCVFLLLLLQSHMSLLN